jgi:LPS export ABC transporter protein LptC
MNNKRYSINIKTGNTTLLTIFAVIAATVLSCDKSIDTIPKSEVLTLPSMTGKDIRSVFNDSGKVQLILTAPVLEQFINTDSPFTEFKSGIKLLFYDGHENPVGSVTAKYAKNSDSKNLWELRDSVVIVNEENEKLETELLFWNQQKDLIYTERFVKITTKDQKIQGTGFESDSRLTKRKIKNVTAIIYLKDEE